MSLHFQSILVIDDEETIRNTLSIILSDEGYLVETAEDGREAIKAARNALFDLALVDIKLPDIEGIELLKRLKEIQPKMAAIIITGFPTLENAIKAVNYKADGYILKPYDVLKLLEMIKRLFAEKNDAYFQLYAEVESATSNI